MSKQRAEKSSEESEHDARSVFDFLYYDSQRIGSFLAQFDPNGHLLAHKHTAGAGSSTGNKFGAGYNGGLPGIAKGEMASEEAVSHSENSASEKSYDPLWTNALNFLDMLDARGMINRSFSSGSIGQFVLACGNLDVVDLRLVRDMWSLPSVRASMEAGMTESAPEGNRRQRRASGKSKKQKEPNEQQIGLDMLGVIPHSIQASVTTGEGVVWSSLRESALIVSGSDLFLKHGRHIPGQWHMLGILDGAPNEEEAVSVTAEEAEIGILGGLGFILDAIGPFARVLLGRPATSYSVTPLLIFRAVEASSEA